ncbi:MAG: NADH-quinone oxidoreductase subunit M, partial [Sphingobacteriaceae bacterium]
SEGGFWYALLGGTTLILGAVYMLRFYQKTMLGQPASERLVLADIRGHELLVLGIVVVLIILIGIFPNSLLHLSEASVSNLLQQIK